MEVEVLHHEADPPPSRVVGAFSPEAGAKWAMGTPVHEGGPRTGHPLSPAGGPNLSAHTRELLVCRAWRPRTGESVTPP